jgi:hypothetical protein
MPKTDTQFKPGNKGKPKGAISHVKKDTQEAIKMLIESNLDNMTIWLSEIAKKNPEKAMYIIVNLLEYSIPKLARTEVTGKDGEKFLPENTTITFK